MSALLALWLVAPSGAQASCAAPANEIVAENCQPDSTHHSLWDIDGAGSPAIQGFATDISVPRGGTMTFKVDSASAYHLDIYRLGWYRGDGARKWATVPGTPRSQPGCQSKPAGLIDCGNWDVTASWSVPSNAVSGLYIAHAVSGSNESHIPFVVRDDDGGSDLLFQTSDTTWQAYNRAGGRSLYWPDNNRAYKVSYNRPFTVRGDVTEDSPFNAEYAMIRWLERNGYDVSYSTGVDTDRRGAELFEHRVFLSVGHDEYWSGDQRRNVERARDAGVNLAFFSGNEVFWKTRWEDNHRTLVTYKETHGDAVDPDPAWTGTWRDARAFNTERTIPENFLTGTLFMVNSGTRAIRVPGGAAKLRLWRDTSLAGLERGDSALLPDGTLGYEWDEDVDNGHRPAGLVRLSSTTEAVDQVLQDEGSVYGPGTATHSLTLYRDANGAGPDALVFGAGTIQWSWGLDDYHDRGNAPASADMQQATVNLLADMHTQPGTLQPELRAASASTDTIAPTAVVDPADATVTPTPLTLTTIHGTAADTGGGRVGAVEVSVDGGASWHPADGREEWSYTWSATAWGSVTPLVRAADDSGNLGPPPPDAPGGPGPGAGGAAGAGGKKSRARRLTLGPRRIRVSRRGVVRVRVGCLRQRRCAVRLKLRRKGRTLATARATVPAGVTRRVAIRLPRRTLRALERRSSLRVTVVARLGKTTTVRRVIRLLPTRRREVAGLR